LFGLFFFYYSSRRNARQRLELERANRAKSEFLSRISHDIRTPMNAIMGMTELALLEKVTPGVENYLRKIKLSNRFLLNLINDILDMSAIESGKIMLRPEAYSIRDFAEFIHSTIDPLMEKRNIEFTITIDPVIQGILVDRLRFNQIFMNLLSNAAKFTPEGGRVELSLIVEKTIGHVLHVRGSVRDTGIGISKEFLPKLFSPFTQENKKHVNVTEGSGLGLAIVKRLVEAMEGTITVQSELGKGTDFIVQIPLEECELHTVAANEKIPDMDVVLQGKRVLVVEDNSINQEVVCHLLEHFGFSCEVANNGQEALDVFKNHRENWFDVILMDIRMPVMDGIEATSQLRKLDRADATIIPIIALTADAYTSERDQIMESGMTEYLAKPVEPQKLIQMLKKVLAMEEKSNNL
jgi:CheY-like chemotaxis protein/nitrogen-specific signal transduction histidine kinase